MKILILTLALSTSLKLWASDVTIKGADFNAKGAEAKLSIKHIGVLNDNPRIDIKGKVLQVSIPNSNLASKIQKTMNGAYITASDSNDETVIASVTLPYSLEGKESEVTMTLKEGLVEVNFPRVEVVKKTIARSPSITDKIVTSAPVPAEVVNSEAEKLDEAYLSSLVKNQEKLANEKHKDDNVNAINAKAEHTDTDRVNLTQASTEKNKQVEAKTTQNDNSDQGKSRFSIGSYVGKFVAFLGLMVLGFYGVLALFKKGIIKKGKLGFLHSTKLVEVLSTTHVAPKRTLMMVKAHKQVFLISNSETGMQLISEIGDVAGLIKSGEEEITGSNFDTNLYSANKEEKEFRLKEDVTEEQNDFALDSLDDMLNDTVPKKSSKGAGAKYDKAVANYNSTNAASAIEKAPVKDQVRFSDQIKTKMKNLKQL